MKIKVICEYAWMLAPRGRSRTQVGTTLTRSSPAEEMMSSGSEVHMVCL